MINRNNILPVITYLHVWVVSWGSGNDFVRGPELAFTMVVSSVLSVICYALLRVKPVKPFPA